MAHVKPEGLVPLYSADNELQDWISPKRVARLEALGIVSVVRKKGHVNRCIMHRRASDPSPLPPTAYMGKAYHYHEHLETGHRVWALRKLRDGEGAPLSLLDLITNDSDRQEERAQLAHV